MSTLRLFYYLFLLFNFLRLAVEATADSIFLIYYLEYLRELLLGSGDALGVTAFKLIYHASVDIYVLCGIFLCFVKKLEDEGMEVNYLTDEQQKAFVEKVQPMYDKYKAEWGEEIFDLAESYNK